MQLLNKKTEKNEEAVEARICEITVTRRIMRAILALGHTNFLCIVPILSDVPKDELLRFALHYKLIFIVLTERCGMR
jgi:hypothetical protein